MAQRLRPDRWLFGAVVALLSLGLVMVYSASTIVAGQRLGDPNYFLKRQLLWAVIGVVGLLMASATDYRRLERLGPPLLVVAAALLVLVLLPPLGQAINGTRRWLRVGGLSMQPVELAKFAFVAYAAGFLARRPDALASVRPGVVGLTAIGAGLAALVLKQPDLGNCLTLVALLFLLLFLAGARPRHLLLLAAPATAALAVAIWMAPYRWRRLTAFLDPEADRLGSGFQIIQSSLALGSGGVLGRGLGASKQKLFYLPEPHTDFVFAVIGEELGLVGTLTVVVLFAMVLWRGLRIGLRAPDAFGAYLALGLTLMLATQAVVNLGVVTGSLPTKGLPLPFVSFGGSALVVSLVSVGVLLSVSQHAVERVPGGREARVRVERAPDDPPSRFRVDRAPDEGRRAEE